jgi:hypothetical protein
LDDIMLSYKSHAVFAMLPAYFLYANERVIF